jgi:hypothetical protein
MPIIGGVGLPSTSVQSYHASYQPNQLHQPGPHLVHVPGDLHGKRQFSVMIRKMCCQSKCLHHLVGLSSGGASNRSVKRCLQPCETGAACCCLLSEEYGAYWTGTQQMQRMQDLPVALQQLQQAGGQQRGRQPHPNIQPRLPQQHQQHQQLTQQISQAQVRACLIIQLLFAWEAQNHLIGHGLM